jgi:hypothetical protein
VVALCINKVCTGASPNEMVSPKPAPHGKTHQEAHCDPAPPSAKVWDREVADHSTPSEEHCMFSYHSILIVIFDYLLENRYLSFYSSWHGKSTITRNNK